MNRLKAKVVTIYAFLIFALFTIIFAIPLALFYRIVWPKDEKKKYELHVLLQKFFEWSANHIPMVTVQLKNEGGEDFSKPAVIICNHQSHLDLLCTLMLSPRIVAMTNQWVWNFPLYAPIIHYLEFYPAADGIDANEEKVKSLLDRGYSVLIFPEGTRSATNKILRFHRGAFYLAMRLGVDIVPIYLDGPGRVLPKTDFTLHRGNILVEVGKRVQAGSLEMGETHQKQTSAWHQRYREKIEELKNSNS